MNKKWLGIAIVCTALLLFIIGKVFQAHITDLIIPLFPIEPDKGYSFYYDFVGLCLNEILWLNLFFLLVLVLFSFWHRIPFESSTTKTFSAAYLISIVVVFLSVTVLISNVALEQFPNSADEYAYLFQAETFSQGKLTNKAPAVPDAFHFNHIAIKQGVRIGRFPPGWPLLLSVSYWIGFPAWLVNPLLATLSLVVFYFFARKFYSEQVALWSLVIFAFSGYYVFNAASYLSHISTLLVTLLFTWSIYLLPRNKIGYALLSGFLLGLIVLIRYYTALLILIPVSLYIIQTYKWNAFSVFVYIGLGSLPGLVLLLGYNYSITGNALTPVTVWAYADERLGFVKGHTFVKGVEHLIRRTFMFFYWCSPGLLIGYFVFLKKKFTSTSLRWGSPADYYFVFLFLGHFFYYQIGGNQYGPRFMLEALPFLILFVVNYVFQLKSRLWLSILLAGIMFAIVKFPFITAREASIVDERQDMYDLVNRNQLSNAVVVVASPTSTIRPMAIGDLTRNDSTFRSEVIYIQENSNFSALYPYYPERTFYRYSRDLNHSHGELLPIRGFPMSRYKN